MAIETPNTICKNINCKRGKDGTRKHYYVCKRCTNQQSWRAVACCPECYQEYMKQLMFARTNGKKIDTTPERTDMTKEQVIELINTPLDVVEQETKEELKDYADENGNIDYEKVVIEINNNIDSHNDYKKKKKKRTQDFGLENTPDEFVVENNFEE